MDAQLTFLIRLIADRKYHQRAVDTYTTEPFRGIDWQMQQMQDFGNGLRGTETEWKHLVNQGRGDSRIPRPRRANLLAGRQAGNVPDWRMVQRNGIESSVANVEYFRRTLPETASDFIGNRPFGQTLLPQLKQAGDRAATEWQVFADFLRTTYEAGLKPCATGLSATTGETRRSRGEGGQPCQDRFAAGTEEYEWRVRHVFGDTRSAEELYEYGAQQVALYSRLIQEVVATIAKDAGLQRVNHARCHQPPCKAIHRGTMTSCSRGIAKRPHAPSRTGASTACSTCPDDYKLDILPTPPVLTNSIDAAYYMAPPFKKSGVGRFYLTPTGNDPAKLRLKNRASIADTAIHEGSRATTGTSST